MVTVLALWVELGDRNSQGPSNSLAPAVKSVARDGWAPLGPGPCWWDKGPMGPGRDPFGTMLGSKGLIQKALHPPVYFFVPKQLLLPCICGSHIYDISCKVLIGTNLPLVHVFPRYRLGGRA